jgi:hypothetical protein
MAGKGAALEEGENEDVDRVAMPVVLVPADCRGRRCRS